VKKIENIIEEVIEEDFLRGNWTSPVMGQTWSAATNASPYRAMSGPVGGISGSSTTTVDPRNTYEPDIPINLAWPLSNLNEYLANAYLSICQSESLIKACLSENPALQDAKSESLAKQLTEVQNIKKKLLGISKNIENFSLNYFQ
jgi:hypothetical protein